MTLLRKLGIFRELDFPLIMSGAGLCKTFEPASIAPLARAADYLVVGSITREPRAGNSGFLEHFDEDGFGLNALGMPNPGLPGVRPASPHNLIVSVAGFSVEDYLDLYDTLASWGRGIELNFGCPNAGHGIFSFDVDAMKEVLLHIYHRQLQHPDTLARQLVGVKLSPYSDPALLDSVAYLLNQFDSTVDYVATCNTFPNAMAFRPDGKPWLRSKQMDGFGGASGSSLRHISLGQAAKFRQLLSSQIDVIRVGGVSTGVDLWASKQVGCVGVQIVTAFVQNDPRKVISAMRESYLDFVSD